MPAHQYVQHDWSPAMWAMILLIMATLVVVGMGLFLLAANRPKQSHGPHEHHPRT
jgi:hypothetical protein